MTQTAAPSGSASTRLPSTTASTTSWRDWAPEHRLALLARLLHARWICQREECDGLPHEGAPYKHARTAQRQPPEDWRVWYVRGGRGSGKTRTGSETFREWILDSPPGDWAIVAPTFGDARDVCVTGESGLLMALDASVSNWNVSTGEIAVALPAGGYSRVFCDGANDGALRIQGKNLRGAWCDEVGLWAKHGWKRAWEESLAFAVRLDPGKIIATGTPKQGHPLVEMLLADTTIPKTRMRTKDNAANLSGPVLADLLRRYEGKRLGQQELDAEFLEDVEGALWTLTQIDALRIPEEELPPLMRIVVGLDPNTSSGETADAAGIIVAALGYRDQHGYILGDRTTVRGGPRAWAQAAVDAYHDFQADRIIAEVNNGGEMVKLVIEGVDRTVPVKMIRASQGKRTRAEPVAALYESGPDAPARVHHVGTFPELEKEMSTWTPEDDSPNRMDALVWALWELKLWAPPTERRGSFVPTGEIPGTEVFRDDPFG